MVPLKWMPFRVSFCLKKSSHRQAPIPEVDTAGRAVGRSMTRTTNFFIINVIINVIVIVVAVTTAAVIILVVLSILVLPRVTSVLCWYGRSGWASIRASSFWGYRYSCCYECHLQYSPRDAIYSRLARCTLSSLDSTTEECPSPMLMPIQP